MGSELKHECWTSGFFRHSRAKRMSFRYIQFDVQKRNLGKNCVLPRSSETFFPPCPSYPLAGCSSAEPTSVSLGDSILTSHSLRWHNWRSKLFFLPCYASENLDSVSFTHRFCGRVTKINPQILRKSQFFE